MTISPIAVEKYHEPFMREMSQTQNLVAKQLEELTNEVLTLKEATAEGCEYESEYENVKVFVTFLPGFYKSKIRVENVFLGPVRDGWGGVIYSASLDIDEVSMFLRAIDLTQFRVYGRYKSKQWWGTNWISFNNPSSGKLSFRW